MMQSQSRAFREKLAFYAMGVAIGLVLLGLFAGFRQAARQASAPPSATTPASPPGTAGSPPAR